MLYKSDVTEAIVLLDAMCGSADREYKSLKDMVEHRKEVVETLRKELYDAEDELAETKDLCRKAELQLNKLRTARRYIEEADKGLKTLHEK